MLRLLHLTATLLSGYAHLLRTEAEIILSMLARTLAADATPIWHRTLILEVFRVLVQHETLLQHIFTSYDVGNAASGVFAKLTASVSKVLLSPAVDFGAHAEYIEKQYLRLHRTASGSSSSARSFSLALYSETDGTGLSSDHMAALAMASIHARVHPFAGQHVVADARRRRRTRLRLALTLLLLRTRNGRAGSGQQVHREWLGMYPLLEREAKSGEHISGSRCGWCGRAAASFALNAPAAAGRPSAIPACA